MSLTETDMEIEGQGAWQGNFQEGRRSVDKEDIFIEEKLIVYLSYLKISPNLKGYACIKNLVKSLVKNPLKKRNITNVLYQELGDRYNMAKNLIDRAMRHALLVSFKKSGIEDFESRTGYTFTSTRPTPREMVCMLAELIRMDVVTFKIKKSFKNLA